LNPVPGILDSNNHLFALAQRGQRFPSLITAIAIVPIMLAIMIATQVWMRVVFRSLLGDGAAADFAAELIGFLSIFGGLWLLLRFCSKRTFQSLGFERAQSGRRVARGALVAAMMMLATAALVMIPGAMVGPGELQKHGLTALGVGLLGFLATSVQSSAEEALFRGWLLPALGVRFGAWRGVAVSSLVFAMAHVTTRPTPLGWANLFLFGMTTALIALAEGGLWSASAWHAVWNWIQGGLLGFSVDRSVSSGLVASIQTTGPDFMTGGSFGPDGGVVATAILLVGIATLLTRRASHPGS